MSIEKGYVSNFETLIAAVMAGDIALLECADVLTGEKVIAIVAVQGNGDDVEMVPMARMFNGNPYEQIIPPVPDKLIEATPVAA